MNNESGLSSFKRNYSLVLFMVSDLWFSGRCQNCCLAEKETGYLIQRNFSNNIHHQNIFSPSSAVITTPLYLHFLFDVGIEIFSLVACGLSSKSSALYRRQFLLLILQSSSPSCPKQSSTFQCPLMFIIRAFLSPCWLIMRRVLLYRKNVCDEYFGQVHSSSFPFEQMHRKTAVKNKGRNIFHKGGFKK